MKQGQENSTTCQPGSRLGSIGLALYDDLSEQYAPTGEANHKNTPAPRPIGQDFVLHGLDAWGIPPNLIGAMVN